MDLALDFKTLLERVHGILEELLLVLVFLLNVRVHVAVLCLLVGDEAEETLVDGDLQLLMVVRVLHNLVDCVFEIVNECVVVADDVAIRRNGLCNKGLSDTKVLDHEAEGGIHGVVLVQLLVK